MKIDRGDASIGKIRVSRWSAFRPGRPHSTLVPSFFLQLCACGILGAGLWLRLAYSGYTTLVPHYSFASADSLLLAAGCVTFVIAFFGCCGAWFQSRCMLITVRIYSSYSRLSRLQPILLPRSTSVWSYSCSWASSCWAPWPSSSGNTWPRVWRTSCCSASRSTTI